MDKIAWTPEGGEAATMGVMLQPPRTPLTQEAYLDLLEKRFRGLIRQQAAAGGDPWAMAQERMAKWDGLTPASAQEIPAMLARQSETLRTGMPLHLFPISPEKIKDQPETREPLDLMQWSDLLANVYPTP